eukprot:TRINITY_DN4321_c0_g1_i1.p2 TRINITY_DN4321_c0_g1~~TRINITY_DN4321_c0_g1_i1.p2  ORF type:complete len:112 (+),score=2.20 TRINITY_DN4321_c0_g1_i1:417-752(+)
MLSTRANFSSWDYRRKRGMYVVGTSVIDSPSGSGLNDLKAIFKNRTIDIIPSKFYVNLREINPGILTDGVFEKEALKLWEETLLKDQELILHSPKVCYNKYHDFSKIEIED